jgi:RNA polymerase sigma-70 factor (ECF subfamily)
VEDEVRLVKQAQAGDEAAFVALYQQNQPSVYTYIYYRVGEQMTAEDLTAEVFVRLVSKIHKFKPGKRPILAWLYTIAGNLVTRAGSRQPRPRWRRRGSPGCASDRRLCAPCAR